MRTFTCNSIVNFSCNSPQPTPNPNPNPFPISMTLEETIETILFQETTSMAQHKFTQRVNRDICHSHSHSHIHIHSHRQSASPLPFPPALSTPFPLTPYPSVYPIPFARSGVAHVEHCRHDFEAFVALRICQISVSRLFIALNSNNSNSNSDSDSAVGRRRVVEAGNGADDTRGL